jgi:hypothetical protein
MTGLVSSASSIPHPFDRDGARSTREPRGGDAEPTRLRRRELADGRVELADEYAFTTIESPELRAAFMAAHFAWAKTRAPWLLKEWADD